jgi:hypothetical protein
MTTNLKALIVILVVAWTVFAIARPFCAEFVASENFLRRRNIWFILTASGFLLPNFWLYAALAILLVSWGAKRDSNPAALYVLLLYALPPAEFSIPQFITANQYRLLSIIILIPIALRASSRKDVFSSGRLTAMDFFVIAFGIWQLALFIPYEAFTNTIRRFSVYFLDSFIIFYSLARSGRSRKDIVEIALFFFLSCCILSILGGFESVKGWLLYQQIPESWGLQNVGAFLLRDGKLRAQVSTGHALALGYVLCLGFGFSLYLREHIKNSNIRKLLPLLMWAGLLGAYSRGPWFTAIIIYLCSFIFQPGGLMKTVKVASIGAAIFGIVLLTPLGPGIIATMPFIGTIDQENVTYRQQLAEVSWRLIMENPWLGDPFFMDNMEELRQGQGIIDLMNGYAAVALFSGLIGLLLYLGVFLLAAWRTLRAAREFSRSNDELALLGYCFVACILGTLFFIGTAGTGPIYYILAGVMASYVRICAREVAEGRMERHNEIVVGQFNRINLPTSRGSTI